MIQLKLLQFSELALKVRQRFGPDKLLFHLKLLQLSHKDINLIKLLYDKVRLVPQIQTLRCKWLVVLQKALELDKSVVQGLHTDHFVFDLEDKFFEELGPLLEIFLLLFVEVC